jgi:hypothetical protein
VDQTPPTRRACVVRSNSAAISARIATGAAISAEYSAAAAM